ncbi:hypothetical protein BH09PAT1_BH09PAT1_8850 [soil metagenome]
MDTQTPPTDIEIRKAIAEVIRGALHTLYGEPVASAVIVHDHWLWGFSLGENAALLKVRTGAEKGKMHGWLIGLSSIDRKRPEPTGGAQGAHHLRNRNPNRRDILRSYRIWCYHQLDTGTAGLESDENSENRLAIEIEAVSDAFSRLPLMGIDNVWLMGNEELQFSLIDVFSFGGSQANVAQGSLGVRVQRPLDLTQY